MTPAGQQWTRNPPTVPGWYWWRKNADKDEKVIGVSALTIWEGRVLRRGGEWQGPITPNEATE